MLDGRSFSAYGGPFHHVKGPIYYYKISAGAQEEALLHECDCN